MHTKTTNQPAPYPSKSYLSLEWKYGVNILEDMRMTMFHYYLERDP